MSTNLKTKSREFVFAKIPTQQINTNTTLGQTLQQTFQKGPSQSPAEEECLQRSLIQSECCMGGKSVGHDWGVILHPSVTKLVASQRNDMLVQG